MSSIAGFSFFQMTGAVIQPASDRMTIVRRPGTDDDVVRTEPRKTNLYEKQTVEPYTALANANAAAADYAAIKNTLVTVIDDLGLQATNI